MSFSYAQQHQKWANFVNEYALFKYLKMSFNEVFTRIEMVKKYFKEESKKLDLTKPENKFADPAFWQDASKLTGDYPIDPAVDKMEL